MVDIRTGASAYLKYEYETSYGAGGTPNKKFGLQDRLTNWSLTHNRIDMPRLNQTTIANYAYGTQSGSLSVGFVLSNPWIFRSIYDRERGKSDFIPKLSERITMCRRHFQLLKEDKNERLCVNMAKKHFSYYLKGFDGASGWRKLFMKTTNPEEINQLLEEIQNEYPS